MRIFEIIKKDEKGNVVKHEIGAKAANIDTDANHRFTTDAEKASWNAKPGPSSGVNNNVVSFTVATTRSMIQSTETLSTLFSKIARWLTDLKRVAFSGNYNDLEGKPAIPGGAAANYAVADNDLTNNSGYLATARVAYEHGREIDQISSDFATRLPGGTGVQWDGTNFWGTTTGGVKKKLGNCAYSLPAMHVQIQDTSAGASPSQIYLPLQGASNVSFRFTKQHYGQPTAAINYVDGTVQQVFSFGRGVFDKTYNINLPKEAANIYFDLVNDSTCTDYRIYNFSVT